MEDEAANGAFADKLANLFSEFGDFNLYKDSQNSFYLEFFHLEPEIVPTQTAEEFISII